MDLSIAHAPKRKRPSNLLLADYPVNQLNSPVVSFFGNSIFPAPTNSISPTIQLPLPLSSDPPSIDVDIELFSASSRSLCPLEPISDRNLKDKTPSQSSASSESERSWSFLGHPSLRLLPKWPGLYSAVPPSCASHRLLPVTTSPSETHPAPSLEGDGAPTENNSPQPLDLLSLFSISPIAASLASNLYGHDLLSLRCLNSTFSRLLSTEVTVDYKRPYYHALLLKSLLCPREGTDSDPMGLKCSSTGGNVGPCVFCKTVVCTTCVSPEIWTTRRYRYICSSCCTSWDFNPVLETDNTCYCQKNLWICRECYKRQWLDDICYDIDEWINSLGIAVCKLCGSNRTSQTDTRLPPLSNLQLRSRKENFRGWFTLRGPVISTTRSNHPKSRLGQKGCNKLVIEREPRGDVGRMRPVCCSWCLKRVDPNKEDWLLRPDPIRRGEEKGRIWMEELERRRRERDGECESGSASSDDSSAHPVEVRL